MPIADIQINTYTQGLQGSPSVTDLTDGGYVVIWQSNSQDGSREGVYAQRYDADGERVGSETQVNTYTDGSQSLPIVTGLVDGGYVVTWTSYRQDGNLGGVYAQRYDVEGESVGNETQISTSTTGGRAQPSITGLTDGGYVVSWTAYKQDGNDGIYAQRFDVEGERVGQETQINTETLFNIRDFHVNHDVTGLTDGGFVLMWMSRDSENQTSIHAQRFDAEGESVGSETQVNTYRGPVTDSSVTELIDGGFVMTWTSKGQDGDSYGIYAQRYDVDGAKVGSETQINTYTDDPQVNPSITGLTDGGYVVTWQSYGQDLVGNYSIYAQRFDAHDVSVGSETRINTYKWGDQGHPSVTGLPDGGYVVTWESIGQDGDGSGIYAQRFDVDGNPFTPAADDGDDTPLPPPAEGVVFSDDFNDTGLGEWYEIS